MIKCYIYIVFYKSGFEGCKGLKTLRFEVLDFFIIQPKLDVNPACGVQKFSPLDVYEVFVFRDLKRTPGSAHNGKKSVYRPHISASKHLFLFSFQFPPHGYFLARVRGGPRYQMGQIFGKFPRGGGSFSIQKFMLLIFAIIDDTSVMHFRKN